MLLRTMGREALEMRIIGPHIMIEIKATDLEGKEGTVTPRITSIGSEAGARDEWNVSHDVKQINSPSIPLSGLC